MTVSEFLDAIVATLNESMPDLREVRRHGGQFTVEELKRFSIGSPAIAVALMRLENPVRTGTGLIVWDGVFSAVCVAKDMGKLKRGEAALNIASEAMLVIDANSFGQDDVYPAQTPTGKVVYNGALDGKGVAFWALEWRQRIQLTSAAEEDCPVPSKIYIGISPETGPGNVDDYQRLGGQDD